MTQKYKINPITNKLDLVEEETLQETTNLGSVTTNGIIIAGNHLYISGGSMVLMNPTVSTVWLEAPTGGASNMTGMRLDSSGAQWLISNEEAYSNALLFREVSANKDRMLIVTGGNIGIGTISPDSLLHISGVNNSQSFKVDASGCANALVVVSGGRVGIGTGSPTATFNVEGTTIFNDAGAEVDFRIKSNEDPNIFLVDSSSDIIGIGTAEPSAKLHVSAATGDILRIAKSGIGRDWWIDTTNPDHLKKQENIVLSADPTDEHVSTKIQFRIDGTEIVEIDSEGATKIGDAGTINYAEFKVDGELNLHGTARVERHWIADATRFKLPAVNPASESFTGLFYTLDFNKDRTDRAYLLEHIPFNWADTTDIEVSIDWCWAGITLTYDVVWGIEYKAIKDGETVTGDGTTITETGTAPTGNVLERTTFTTKILGSALEADDNVAIRVFRDGANELDTLNCDAKLVCIHFRLIQDKLGKAT